MSCRCPVCRSTRWLRDPIGRWREDWDRAARAMDPGFEQCRAARESEHRRLQRDMLRQLVEQAERERRENDPNVN